MLDPTPVLDMCQEALGYRFKDRTLLVTALTHRSFVNERRGSMQDNERLEFLGDAVLSIVVSSLLFELYPNAPEGELTRRRADLVSERGLSLIAERMDLGACLNLGKGEERSGGRKKPRLLSNALEACFGAIYLDGGLAATLQSGDKLFRDFFHNAVPGSTDFKSRAQEWFQSQGLPPPRYELKNALGPDHAKTFRVALVVGDECIAKGDGRSKAEAEQAAAQAALAAAKPQDQ
ncbi:MAG: ribonuclease III [Myxococcales bacterium]|nr:ribonuclease III [Myxococcales bacterium]MCB9707929.1 ribonuclease III [Myxococcales bacterium]